MCGEDEDAVLGHTRKYYFVNRVISSDKYITEVIFRDLAHTKGAPEFKAVEITHHANEKITATRRERRFNLLLPAPAPLARRARPCVFSHRRRVSLPCRRSPG